MTNWVGRLSLATKIGLVLTAWYWFLRVHLLLRTHTLPRVVERLRPEATVGERSQLNPRRLGRIVGKSLRLRDKQARCLIGSLVLYRMLLDQGMGAELVIGLPADARDHLAHAWIEVDGIDVGPPPGRFGHTAIARYGSEARPSSALP
jgi:hypothetical protein